MFHNEFGKFLSYNSLACWLLCQYGVQKVFLYFQIEKLFLSIFQLKAEYAAHCFSEKVLGFSLLHIISETNYAILAVLTNLFFFFFFFFFCLGFPLQIFKIHKN